MTEIIGWVGVIAYISAYALLSIGSLSSDKFTYHFLNSLGGLCLVINAIPRNDTPGFVVNLVWMLIAIFAIIKVNMARSKD